MRLWITGSLQEVKDAVKLGLAGAVVTNPTVISQWSSGTRALEDVVAEACDATGLPLYVQLYGPDKRSFIRELRHLKEISKLIVPKLPATMEGLAATRDLASEGETVLVTAVCSIQQAFLAAVAGAEFICPYFARLNDAGQEAATLIQDSRNLYEGNGFATEIIPASIRSIQDLSASLFAGAHGAILPVKVFYDAFENELTKSSLATFEQDWQTIPYGRGIIDGRDA